MATKSVATLHPESPEPIGTEADLYLIGGGVLTVSVSRYSTASPPDRDSVKQLHRMIEGLARASIAISSEMVSGGPDVETWQESADCVGFATMLLSQLAGAVTTELLDAEPKERAA